MSNRLTPSEQLAYSTVRIEAVDGTGEKVTGTGFFYRCLEGTEKFVPVIATNKHVVSGSVSGFFHLTQRDDNGDPIPAAHIRIQLEPFEERWIVHPDPDVDLAVMPIAPLLADTNAIGKRFFFITLDRSLIPTPADLDDIGALEDVIMIGYPNGIWDRVSPRDDLDQCTATPAEEATHIDLLS